MLEASLVVRKDFQHKSIVDKAQHNCRTAWNTCFRGKKLQIMISKFPEFYSIA